MGIFSKLFKSSKPEISLDSLNDDLAPRKKGNIPEMAITLGMINPKHYEIYKMCNGQENIAKLSEKSQIDPSSMKRIIQKLYSMALIQI